MISSIVALTIDNKLCMNMYTKWTGDISWLETSVWPESLVRQIAVEFGSREVIKVMLDIHPFKDLY